MKDSKRDIDISSINHRTKFESSQLKKMIFLLAMTGLTAIILVRLAFFGLYNSPYLSYQGWTAKRTRQMLSQLEKSHSDNSVKRVVFIGPSTTVIGIDALDIQNGLSATNDSQGKSSVLNLGLFDLNPETTKNLLRRISSMAVGQNKNIQLALLDFQPDRLTERFTMQKSQSVTDASNSQIYSMAMLTQDFFSRPSQTINYFFVRFVLGGISPSLVRYACARAIRQWVDRLTFREYDIRGYRNLSNQFWRFDGPKVIGWDKNTNGHFYFDFPYIDPLIFSRIGEFKIPLVRNHLRGILNSSWDTENMKFDPEAIDQFNKNIKYLRRIATHVIVYYLPQAPDLLISDQARENITQTLENMRTSTGIEILDLSQKSLFTEEDYFDLTHLNRLGQAKLTHFFLSYFAQHKELFD